MLHELWEEPLPEGGFGFPMFCLAGPHGDGARAMLPPGSRLIWTVEADSHFEVMTLYYQHQGRGVYTTEYPEHDKKSYRELGFE